MYQYVIRGIQYDAHDPLIYKARTFDIAAARVCELVDYFQQYWLNEVTGHISEITD